MANLIDLSEYKKEDTIIKSLNGTEYIIPGNFSSEYFVKLYKTKNDINKLKKGEDIEKAFQLLKTWAFELISMDKSKTVTMDTIDNEFNDFKVLEILLTSIMQTVNS
jgi:hypothetical protein